MNARSVFTLDAKPTTRWYDEWSSIAHGTGGLRGFTEHAILSRHEEFVPHGLWQVSLSLSCGYELARMVCQGPTFCHAVQDDFGNLVAVFPEVRQ